jgi:hypothetical protein
VQQGCHRQAAPSKQKNQITTTVAAREGNAMAIAAVGEPIIKEFGIKVE